MIFSFGLSEIRIQAYLYRTEQCRRLSLYVGLDPKD
jgi:hypothetical protein